MVDMPDNTGDKNTQDVHEIDLTPLVNQETPDFLESNVDTVLKWAMTLPLTPETKEALLLSILITRKNNS